jgi:hypothetical protein
VAEKYLRLRRRERNVLDIPLYRSGDCTHNPWRVKLGLINSCVLCRLAEKKARLWRTSRVVNPTTMMFAGPQPAVR